jgi:hypothetical protein
VAGRGAGAHAGAGAAEAPADDLPGGIGAIGADVFDAPVAYLGRTVEVAADEPPGPQMAEVFALTADRPVRFNAQAIEQVRARSEEMAAMFDWFNTVGFRADLNVLRDRHPVWRPWTGG